jgi:hypothetical protein
MNHLTNIYKHKCEQLQEQLNNFQRMLNEEKILGRVIRAVVNAVDDIPINWVNPITSLGRTVQRNIKDVQTMFRNLPPDPAKWLEKYNLLNYTEREYFFRLFGDIGSAGNTGLMNIVMGDTTLQVRIFREAGTSNGRAGIFYWNTSSNSWVRFPTWQNVPGVGRNADYGISYSKEWLNGLGRDIRIEARPDSTDVFSPASPQDFIGRGGVSDRIPGSGGGEAGSGGGGSGLGQSTGNPG